MRAHEVFVNEGSGEMRYLTFVATDATDYGISQNDC